MRGVIAVVIAALALSGCGIKRPLVRPRDIPAYEKKRQDKLERLQDDTEMLQPAPQQNGAE